MSFQHLLSSDSKQSTYLFRPTELRQLDSQKTISASISKLRGQIKFQYPLTNSHRLCVPDKGEKIPPQTREVIMDIYGCMSIKTEGEYGFFKQVKLMPTL